MDNKCFDSIVIGAGHAGCESALALARTGNKVLLLTLSLDAIAFLACNPSIGGTSKGQLVSEIDALGGEMGVNIDNTYLQLKMLNIGKGTAVHSLRAQADKNKYHERMKQVLENTPNLTLKQGEVISIGVKNNKIEHIITAQGEKYFCKSLIVCTGVYLKSKIIIGEYTKEIGPNNFAPANYLTQSLKELGLNIRRFKTGTPARINRNSIDFNKTECQKGDTNVQSFSYLTTKKIKNTLDCYLTYTNEKTHKIIKDNLSRAPLFSGVIEGVGPRYCPSIEDKVVRFADRERHQVFLEPEALNTNEIYIQGVSTSMPIDVQEKIYQSIDGLENAQIMRDAYAIEYDCIDSLQLYPTLQYKNIEGLYFAGQINGTSGYEEAAAQGILAGINASLYNQNKNQIVLKRSDAYIGVLVDDLVTKGTNEPYRMMTSRAEYRLWLRQDNADLRLTQIGRDVGLVKDDRYQKYLKTIKNFKNAEKDLKIKLILNEKLIKFFEKNGEKAPNQSISVYEALKRPNITAESIKEEFGIFSKHNRRTLEYLNTRVKYEGYLKMQEELINKAKSYESMEIPKDIDYKSMKGIRIEALQKLEKIKPLDISQATRISGVSPADIAILCAYIKMNRSK